jgi:NAD+ kinase
MSKQVGIVAKTESREVLGIARTAIKLIQSHDLSVVLERSLAKTLRQKHGLPLSRMKADLIITLGGDGTVLKTVREIPDVSTPIFAVNLGRHGYLTEVEAHNFEGSFERWLKGQFYIEKQWLLSVFYRNRLIGKCLNEALLIPKPVEKMLNLDVFQYGHRIIRARSDGFIVATPTGSTAHAFSAGGPVVDTSLDVLSLALIAPLQPVKSILVPATKKLRVTIAQPGPAAILVNDGKAERDLRVGESIEFKKSQYNAHFVRFGDEFLVRNLRRLASEREN